MQQERLRPSTPYTVTMASTVHDPSSQCSNRTCVYYPRIHHVSRILEPVDFKPPAEIYEMLFPGSCSQCSTLRIRMDGLCPFCHHLRLQHIFYCRKDREPDLEPCLVLGRLADLQLRSSCTFCAFILRVVQQECQTLHVNVDGRDIVMLSLSGCRGVSETEFATRFYLDDARVQVCNGSQHTSIDSFMADETWNRLARLDTLIGIRQRQPPDEPNMMGGMVNWQRLRNWIKECVDHHTHESPDYLLRENVLESLLFIDVEKDCIVSAPSSSIYIALSYVWGDHAAGMIQTTKQSINNFRKAGSLPSPRIPATIKHAMLTCRMLGVRYLWLDRFCIVQDDELQKHEQIRSMGMIYSCALLTICATAGSNADYGLPGVQSRLRAQVRPRTFAFGIEALLGRPKDHSVWNSRGWTYQEMVLSRRRLLFTDDEVFFECSQGASAEVSTPMEPPSLRTSLDGFDTKIETYMNHVRNYIERNLSYKSDVYNAFSGVGGTIYPSKDLIHGLPTSAFDEAILWETSLMHNDDRWPRHNLEQDIYVPSWSWASEIGHGVSYIADCPLLGSFAKWAFMEQQDQVRVIESVETPADWNPDIIGLCHDRRLYLALVWREHLIENAPSFTICWERTFEEVESSVIKGWPTYRDYWEEAHGRARIETNVQTKPVGRLLLRTSVASFRLEAPKVPPYLFHDLAECVVYSEDNFPCGLVRLLPVAIEKEMPEIVESFPKFGRRKIQLVALSCVHFRDSHFQMLFKAHDWLSTEEKSERYGYSIAFIAMRLNFALVSLITNRSLMRCLMRGIPKWKIYRATMHSGLIPRRRIIIPLTLH